MALVATIPVELMCINHMLMAASVLATLPMLILFLLFQRQFITAMAATGLIVEK